MCVLNEGYFIPILMSYFEVLNDFQSVKIIAIVYEGQSKEQGLYVCYVYSSVLNFIHIHLFILLIMISTVSN